jgi:hypothetical protein
MTWEGFNFSEKQKAPRQRPPCGDPHPFPDATFPGNSDEEFFIWEGF